ncbi:MAG: hypothetical protein GY811_28280 [Myxococcales bacterium]|nr:hypothetical protein [Myxococcales bacterium]
MGLLDFLNPKKAIEKKLSQAVERTLRPGLSNLSNISDPRARRVTLTRMVEEQLQQQAGTIIEGTEVAVSSAGGGLEIRNATLIGEQTALSFFGARSGSATVTGTTIEANGVAVEATHDGKITFSSSNIRGKTAIDASSNAAVVLGESKVEGNVKKRGGSTVVP